MLIKEMTDSGLKPRQILKRLRQTNPDLLSTPKHVYNIKAKLRHGNVNVRRFKTLRPCTSLEGNSQPAITAESWRRRYPLRNPNLIGGRFVDSQSSTSIDVVNPATQQVVSQVPLSTGEEFKAAVFAAKRAFPLWRHTPVTTRQRIMFKLQELIQRDIVEVITIIILDKLAFAIATEEGKTLKDAYNEVQRGPEILDCARGEVLLQTGSLFQTCQMASILLVSESLLEFVQEYARPLLCCDTIVDIFPAAISCGNTFILKPAEKAPGACMILTELVMEASLPNGVLSIIHGTYNIVDAISDDDDIEVVSFVGSMLAQLYMRGRPFANKSKCAKANMGAKNYAVVMPDANVEATLNSLFAAGFGAAGQRCATINNVVFVGGSDSWEHKLVERAKVLKSKCRNRTWGRPRTSNQQTGAYETLISTPVGNLQLIKEQISKLTQAVIDSGAKLVLDGRQIAPFYEDNIATGHVSSRDPGHLRGNSRLRLKQGSELCFAGDLNANGKPGVHFYTQVKTVTQQWKEFPNSEGGLPTLTSNYPQSNGGLSQGLQALSYRSGDGDYRSADGVYQGLQSIEYQSGDGASLGLQSRDFSNGDGVHLALDPKDFPACIGESLGEHSRDIPSGNDISPIIPISMDLIEH
ncbi:hypothetical protein P3S68_009872 [Capsicum galapagoense]